MSFDDWWDKHTGNQQAAMAFAALLLFTIFMVGNALLLKTSNAPFWVGFVFVFVVAWSIFLFAAWRVVHR